MSLKPRAVICLGGYYRQGRKRYGWGQLSCAESYTAAEYRATLVLFPGATWFSVLEDAKDAG